MLYKDFQWDVIFHELANLSYPILPGGPWVRPDIESNNIDEKIVENILSQQYMKGENLDLLKGVFSTIFLSRGENGGVPYLNHSIVEILKDFKLATDKPSAEGYALLSSFKSIKDLVVIKTARKRETNLNILYEYFIGINGINPLRKLIPNFAYTLASFRCNPLPITNTNINMNKICTNDRKDPRYYIIYEKINGMSLNSFCTRIKTNHDCDKIISYLIQIALALQIAQQESDIIHYDLHTENVILREIDEKKIISYVINGIVYNIETDKIPTIIDYGFSHFIYKDMPFGTDSFLHLGINPTKACKGHDLYKLMMFTCSIIFSYNKNLFERIKWILLYYDGIDNYNIVNSIKQNNYDKLKKSFDYGYKNYFSATSPHCIELEPITFIHWIKENKPEFYNSFVKTTPIINPCISSDILESYKLKLEQKKIFKLNPQDELQECKILDGSKSFVLNKYIVNEFENILKYFGKNIKNHVELLTKVNELKIQNENNIVEYKINDDKLLKLYTTELDNIINNVDVNDYINKIKNIKNIDNIKTLSLDFLSLYCKVYDNYCLFIEYSKENVDKNFQHYSYVYNKILSDFNKKKSEYIFETLRTQLDLINNVLVEDGEKIAPSYWKINNNFINALKIVIYVLSDIRKFYPWLNFVCDTMETFIFKLIDNLNIYSNIVVYIPTRSNHQLSLTYTCNKNGLLNLILRHTNRKDHQVIKNYIYESIYRKKTDYEIYIGLKQFLLVQNHNKDRGQKRIKDLYFLWENKHFQQLKNQRNFSYLDYGGGDGSITSSIGKFLNLNKENTISLDVEDWFGNKPEILKDNVTYVISNGILPFQDNHFSLITAFQVLHHVENIKKQLNELNRIIIKGGLLLIREHDRTDDCSELLMDIEHAIFEVLVKEPPNNTFLQEYEAYYKSSDEWTNLLYSVGFKHITYIGSYNNKNPTNYYYALYQKI